MSATYNNNANNVPVPLLFQVYKKLHKHQLRLMDVVCNTHARAIVSDVVL